MSFDIRQTFLRPTATILDAIELTDRLGATGFQIALVVDDGDRLLGTITDGDVRRGILRRVPLESQVTKIMNRNPRTGHLGDSTEALATSLKQNHVNFLPLLDAEGRVRRLESLETLGPAPAARPNWVVLMAGGLGKRLMPLTNDVPKPLLEVGGKPILQTILESLIAQNFVNFYISVNYKAEMVMKHFGDGSRWGATIRYLSEDRKLGTAGPLGLIEEPPEDPLLVMNGDLLTRIDFASLLHFHREHAPLATLCVRAHDLQVPYGIVTTSGHWVTSIEEKPIRKMFINAGIYVIEPALLDRISRNGYLDMPHLLHDLIDKPGRGESRSILAFPVREFWLDIGRPDDFDRAQEEFDKFFLG